MASCFDACCLRHKSISGTAKTTVLCRYLYQRNYGNKKNYSSSSQGSKIRLLSYKRPSVSNILFSSVLSSLSSISLIWAPTRLSLFHCIAREVPVIIIFLVPSHHFSHFSGLRRSVSHLLDCYSFWFLRFRRFCLHQHRPAAPPFRLSWCFGCIMHRPLLPRPPP